MSRFTDSASTAYSLSITAMEEASRVGQREADIDHLFLALTVSEQVGGQVLRRLGISLDAARQAVATQHADQLAGLGVRAETAGPGRIVFHETEGYDWGRRSVAVIEQANKGGGRGDAAAVLRALVDEPSGMIESILHRLDSSPEEVIAALDESERGSARAHSSRTDDALSGSVHAFVPAPVDEVWAVLADASRLPEWEDSIGRVDDGGPAVRAGEVWMAHAQETGRGGRPIRVKPQLRRQRVEVAEIEEPQRIVWRISAPDAPRANTKRITIDLEPAAGGTQLRLTAAWVRNSTGPVRRIVGSLLRPVYRPIMFIQVGQLRAGISRLFR